MKSIENEENDKSETASPYLSKRVYKNYEGTMKEKNQKRKKDGLVPIPIRSYEEWSGK